MADRFSAKLASLTAFMIATCFAGPLLAQTAPPEVAPCLLANNPGSFDKKTLRFRGTLSVHFEDFSLELSNCHTQQAIWLAFGGDVPGLIPSTVNDNSRKPGVDIEVDSVAYGLKKDENFRRLYALLAARKGDKPAYRVTATMTGTFFAGEESTLPNGQTYFHGYGHLGCCALFVITQVSDVVSVPPADLTIRGTVTGPGGKPVKDFPVVNEVLGGFPPERQKTLTNENGAFEFSDAGPLLRFEAPNYRPAVLAVEPGGPPVHIRLDNAERSDWVVPLCGEKEQSGKRIGFSAQFAVPKGLDYDLSSGDDGWRFYSVFPSGHDSLATELVIANNSTQSVDEASEDSTQAVYEVSEERWIKDSSGKPIGIDARGRLRRGGYWRRAIFLSHDSVNYRLRAGEQTNLLDGLIDSMCITKLEH